MKPDFLEGYSAVAKLMDWCRGNDPKEFQSRRVQFEPISVLGGTLFQVSLKWKDVTVSNDKICLELSRMATSFEEAAWKVLENFRDFTEGRTERSRVAGDGPPGPGRG